MKASRAVETTHRVVYTIPAPCYWADVEAVFAAIRNSGDGPDPEFDDSVLIEPSDDAVRISFVSAGSSLPKETPK